MSDFKFYNNLSVNFYVPPINLNSSLLYLFEGIV
jgi:hypothetical protein